MAKAYATKVKTDEERVVLLAKEYTNKLQAMVESLIKYYNEGNRTSFSITFHNAKCVIPVARELAQAISQQSEHGTLEPFSRLEARLRLAELEASIETADQLMIDFKNFYSWKF
jgi:hypothetical protein